VVHSTVWLVSASALFSKGRFTRWSTTINGTLSGLVEDPCQKFADDAEREQDQGCDQQLQAIEVIQPGAQRR
jgi:hypothetical protein